VADAFSRKPEVCSTERTSKCGWYQRIVTGVKNRPSDFSDYHTECGLLYRHILHDLNFREVDSTEQWKLCIPREERATVLKRQHDDPVKHLGMAKTIARIARLYYWPGMFQDITHYVRCCPTCLVHKVPPMKPVGNFYTIPITAPWKQVTLDLVDLLPRFIRSNIYLG